MLLEKSYYPIVKEHVAVLKGELAYFSKEIYRRTGVQTRGDGNFAESNLSEGKTSH